MLAEVAPSSTEGLEEQGFIGNEAPTDGVLQVVLLAPFLCFSSFFFLFISFVIVSLFSYVAQVHMHVYVMDVAIYK